YISSKSGVRKSEWSEPLIEFSVVPGPLVIWATPTNEPASPISFQSGPASAGAAIAPTVKTAARRRARWWERSQIVPRGIAPSPRPDWPARATDVAARRRHCRPTDTHRFGGGFSLPSERWSRHSEGIRNYGRCKVFSQPRPISRQFVLLGAT